MRLMAMHSERRVLGDLAAGEGRCRPRVCVIAGSVLLRRRRRSCACVQRMLKRLQQSAGT